MTALIENQLTLWIFAAVAILLGACLGFLIGRSSRGEPEEIARKAGRIAGKAIKFLSKFLMLALFSPVLAILSVSVGPVIIFAGGASKVIGDEDASDTAFGIAACAAILPWSFFLVILIEYLKAAVSRGALW